MPIETHWKNIKNENCQNGKIMDNFLFFFQNEVHVSTIFQKLLKRYKGAMKQMCVEASSKGCHLTVP